MCLVSGQGAEVHIVYMKADLASRFSPHPSLPTWHTQSQTLNFPTQGLGCPYSRGSFLENPDTFVTSFFLLFLSFSPLCLQLLFLSLFPISSFSLLIAVNQPLYILIWLELAHGMGGEGSEERRSHHVVRKSLGPTLP